MDNLIYWIWLSEKCSPDTPLFSVLYHTFGSAEKIFNADEDELNNVFSLTKGQVKVLSNKDTQKAENILKECQMKNIGILTYENKLFPTRLRTIKNPPVLLYYKGTIPEFDKEVCIGTVGTRTPSSYGCRCAYEIAFDLSLSGAYVISGMAMGIDSVCHTAALDAGGKTVAVLGCGVDVIYPKQNEDIYKRLCSNATIISEYAPGTKATRYSFPQRNRIISGLSLGTLIVESQIKSGAMITAHKTIEQNRDLFAVPGRLGEYNSTGPNSLIKSGAKAIQSAEDILREYEFLYPEKIKLSGTKKVKKNNPFDDTNTVIIPQKKAELKTVPDLSITFEDMIEKEDSASFDHLPEEQKLICESLSKSTPKSLEEIANNTHISVSDIMSSLTILEIQGIVKAVPGGSFVLV